jgi:hypothetical protein
MDGYPSPYPLSIIPHFGVFMLESILIACFCWMVFLTGAVWHLYSRPVSGLDPDDIDMIKSFMDKVRGIARSERRKKG